jgi:dTDP-4-amino-4,6-dideoxygalactose transaminase
VVRLNAAAILRKSHRQVFDELRQRNIGVNLHYIPVHLQPYYRRLGFAPGQYPQAEAYGETAITLPLYPAMTDRQQDSVVAALKEII